MTENWVKIQSLEDFKKLIQSINTSNSLWVRRHDEFFDREELGRLSYINSDSKTIVLDMTLENSEYEIVIPLDLFCKNYEIYKP